MKLHYLIIFFSVIGYPSAFAQDTGRTAKHFSFVADSLFPASSLKPSRKKKVEQGANMLFYTSQGKKLDKMETMERMQGNELKILPFVDSSLKMRVGVLVPKKGGGRKKDSLKGKPGNPEGRTIPSKFEMDLLNGGSYSYSKKEENDSILVLNFWFTACKPCKMEIPELNRMVEEFKGEPVRFQAVSHNKASRIRSFLKERKFEYVQGVGAEHLYKSFGINSFPAHIVVDRKGKVRFFKTGYTADRVKEVKKCIEGLLE